MIAIWGILLSIFLHSTFAEKTYVEPEYLNMLRETGQHEEFARLLGLEDVNLVHPLEGRTEEELEFTTVSPLGDILLTPDQLEESRQAINFTRYRSYKWRDNIVPYEIGKNEFSPRERALIDKALQDLNGKLQNVDIVPRTEEKDYVYIMNGQGCYSKMGRNGGQQPISLQANGCLRRGTIMHEVMHAMGMIHEQSRSDRDDHVTVLYENIPKSWHSQYQKVRDTHYTNLGPYDPSSVMHYSMYAPETGKLAFKFRDSTVNTASVGQRYTPTRLDLQKADKLYSEKN